MKLLLKILLFTIIGIGIAFSYYLAPGHIESAKGYAFYVVMLLLAYSTYKLVGLFSGKPKVLFTPLTIAGWTLLHVFILCITFFDISGGTGSLILFSKIVGFSFFPILITLINYSFGKKFLRLLSGFKNEDERFQIILSLGLGFVAFFTTLVTIGVFGFYNPWVVFGILLVFIGISFREFIETCISLHTHTIEFDNHRATDNFFENINLRLLSTEFLFIILTFLIGINFINIVRPMPIGWDDLGVYMNYPNIIAHNAQLLAGNGMIAWQTFTGIGFMFNSTPQAFFLSDLGGILSLIVLGLSCSYFVDDKKKGFINLPLLACTILFAMPMVIFQQAKDIKVDLGLFFMSSVAIFASVYVFMRYLGYKNDNLTPNEGIFQKISSVFKGENGDTGFFDTKTGVAYILIIGLVVGLAFSIKFTSLMLILGIIGIFFYAKIGLAGFLGYFFLFIGFFTKLKLWDYLNVNYPKDNPELIQNTFLFCLILGILFLGYATWKYSFEAFKKLGIIIGVFTLGICITLAPWIGKNMYEIRNGPFSVGWLLYGKGGEFVPDYTKIHSKSTLTDIEIKQKQTQATTSSGKTVNEDLGRYFGYEDGINNYLKLPLNLTLQTNQAGEYTDITFLFLALIPIIFIFLSYRSPWFALGIVGGIGIIGMYYFIPSSVKLFTDFFATQKLPAGYLWIIGIFLAPLPFFLYGLDNSRNSQIFKLLLIFATLYNLLFVISAYGIVWYGIAMYFLFLAMIVVAGKNLVHDDGTDGKENTIRFLGATVLLMIGAIYFFGSSYPHGFKNIAAAGFNDYKGGQVSQSEGIFNAHPDYYPILVELNIGNKEKATEQIINIIKKTSSLKVVLTSQLSQKLDLISIENLLEEVQKIDNTKLGGDIQASVIKGEARKVLDTLYTLVLYPEKELQNTGNIYRIGTFLTYFINNNRTRYYDDSLIFNFDTYFSDKNPEKTVERMKKIGLSYLLVDLNAATIDRDPRHDLTRRYKNLLSTFRAKNLELVQTDSICLRIALDENNDNYLDYAGVNYESYDEKGNAINRGIKQAKCYNHILELLSTGKVTNLKYSYLIPVGNYLNSLRAKKGGDLSQDELVSAFKQSVSHGWLAFFRIK